MNLGNITILENFYHRITCSSKTYVKDFPETLKQYFINISLEENMIKFMCSTIFSTQPNQRLNIFQSFTTLNDLSPEAKEFLKNLFLKIFDNNAIYKLETLYNCIDFLGTETYNILYTYLEKKEMKNIENLIDDTLEIKRNTNPDLHNTTYSILLENLTNQLLEIIIQLTKNSKESITQIAEISSISDIITKYNCALDYFSVLSSNINEEESKIIKKKIKNKKKRSSPNVIASKLKKIIEIEGKESFEINNNFINPEELDVVEPPKKKRKLNENQKKK